MAEILPPSQIKQLVALVSGSETSRLGDTGEAFKALFQSRVQAFKALFALKVLLEERLFEFLAQRIAAYYLLACAYDLNWAEARRSFPFLSFFIKAGGNETNAVADRALLQALLHKGPALLKDARPLELADRLTCEPATLKTLAQLCSLYGVLPPPVAQDTSGLVTLEPRDSATASREDGDAVSSRVSPAEPSRPDVSDNGHGAARSASAAPSTTDQSAPSTSAPGTPANACLRPGVIPRSSQAHFARMPPPVMEQLTADTAWVQLSLHDTLVWDDSAEVLPSTLHQLQKLVVDAQVKPLAPLQQKQFLAALETWPRLVQHIGVSPTQLPALVEHNNMLAVELLLKLIGLNSPRISTFLDVLVRMDLSVHSMEVVKRLTSVASLPMDFVHLYISSCIQSCETIEHKNLQNRLVRLVCVFLQSLVRTKVIDVRAVQYEVLSFCVNFSRIREAASLFRLLQSLQEQEGAEQAGDAFEARDSRD